MTLTQVKRLLIDAFKEWNDDKASRMAAALAYYTVFSLAPLLLLITAIAGFFVGQDVAQDQIMTQFQNLLGQQGAAALQGALEKANSSGSGIIASIVSIVTLLVGASGVFTQLQNALNNAWEVKPKPKLGLWAFIRSRVLSFSMILVIAFLLVVSLVVSAGLAAMGQFLSNALPGSDILWQIVNFALSIGLLTLLFAMMYKVLPDAKIDWADVWIGALTTAVLFAIGKQVLGLYIGNGAIGSAYGAASFLLVLLTWIYYSAQILFFGAELTQVYARRYGSRIQPQEYAVSTIER